MSHAITPRIVSVKPTVMTDQRRVMVDLIVTDFPPHPPNIRLNVPSQKDDAFHDVDFWETNPYPNVELTIFNEEHETVSHLFIIEHKETQVQLTLHLRKEPQVGGRYILRTTLTHFDRVLDQHEQPFTLAS